MTFRPFKIGRALLKPGRPLIAGILNVTPDSFSDGGLAFTKKNAVGLALRMENEGADIIDIGGESSRPGAAPVPLGEELRRLLPVIRAIRKKSRIPISIDTSKPETARAAIEEGADAINDITGFRDPAMMETAALLGKPVIVMHMRGNPRTMQKNPRYRNVVEEVTRFLEETAKKLEKNGVKKIIIDPGIGFGKTVNHNLAILSGIGRFVKTGRPVMVGASRKSFIGKITGAETADRVGGTLSAHLLAVVQGAAVIRAHDVAVHRQALDVALKIRGGGT
jgi:dihydropteroate synthase